MGSFQWDNPGYVQYHNGRPLSVALTEPCNCQRLPYQESDFALQYRPRSQSSGRRIHREAYRVYHPNVQYASFCYSPPFARRAMDYDSSRDAFVEKFETVTIEEQCRPNYGISYVRTPSPPVRQVKIRSRPASCVDLHRKEATDNQQWTKIVDEKVEEHHDWHYNYTIPFDRVVPFQRDSSSTMIDQHAASTTTSGGFHIPITSTLVRPVMRDVGTITDSLPKKPIRPLSISETQVLDRYEKNEKIRRDSITDVGTSISYITTQRPLHRSSDDDDDSDEKQSKRGSKKLQRKEFIHRMHARNGTGLRSYNSLNIYSDRGKNQMIIRPTVKPREALVDAPAIVAPPGESEPSTPITIENSSRSRYYFSNN